LTRFALILCLLGCSDINGPEPPRTPHASYEFTFDRYLRSERAGYWAFAAGEITNTGANPIRLRPELRLFYSLAAKQNNTPDVIGIGHTGWLKNIYDPEQGLRERVTDIPGGHTLQYYARTDIFPFPPHAEGLYYSFTFTQY